MCYQGMMSEMVVVVVGSGGDKDGVLWYWHEREQLRTGGMGGE